METLLKKTESRGKKFLSTGSVLLDMAVSCHITKYGGLPTKSIIEFSGTGASGKSYILGEICGDALRKGYTSVIVDDIERRWDLSRLGTFGIKRNDKRFKYLESQSRTVEGCFDRMFETLDKVKESSKILYIVDPIAALYSEVELKSTDKMGQARAKALHKRMRFLKDRVGNNSKDITVLFSNQLIDNVGVMFGPKKKTPMGNALIHWPSLKIRFNSPGKLSNLVSIDGGKSRKITRGILLTGIITKNSEDDAYREAEFSIRYGYGIDNIRDCVEWLKLYTKKLNGHSNKKNYQFPKKEKELKSLDSFIKYIETNNFEKLLFKLTRKYYRKTYDYPARKRKTYLL